jgi:hypothetical protein
VRHETYFLRGGMEAIYDDMPGPLGLLTFTQAKPVTAALFSARRRAGLQGEEQLTPFVPEAELESSPTQ